MFTTETDIVNLDERGEKTVHKKVSRSLGPQLMRFHTAALLLGQGIPPQNNVFSPSDQFLIWPVQPSPWRV